MKTCLGEILYWTRKWIYNSRCHLVKSNNYNCYYWFMENETLGVDSSNNVKYNLGLYYDFYICQRPYGNDNLWNGLFFSICNISYSINYLFMAKTYVVLGVTKLRNIPWLKFYSNKYAKNLNRDLEC